VTRARRTASGGSEPYGPRSEDPKQNVGWIKGVLRVKAGGWIKGACGVKASGWLKDADASGAVEVLAGTLLFVVFYYQAAPAKMAAWLTPTNRPGLGPWLGQAGSFGAGLLLLVIVPVLWWTVGRRRSPTELGFRVGDWRFGLAAAVVGAFLLTPLLFVNAGNPAFQSTYPLVRAAGASVSAFIVWELIYLGYYIAWEGFFRGLLLIGLKDRMGLWPAMVLQTVLSTVAHFHRPEPETLAALVAGLGFGWLALRTRSIWYVVLLHWYVGAATDLFCLLRGF